MYGRFPGTLFLLLFPALISLSAQSSDSLIQLTGIVCDQIFVPISATHVVNLSRPAGDVTDSLGIFSLPARYSDTLLISNIAYRDTILPVRMVVEHSHVIMSPKYYPIGEAKIFKWGATYSDFKRAVVEMAGVSSLGEEMGLPRQDPDYIPFDMDGSRLKSPAFLITSPVSFFYYNFNKKAVSARKVFWMDKNAEKQRLFDSIVNRENLASITGFAGDELKEFHAYLLQHLTCDIHCTELELYAEIYRIFNAYSVR